jgi:hypothetical protein
MDIISTQRPPHENESNELHIPKTSSFPKQLKALIQKNWILKVCFCFLQSNITTYFRLIKIVIIISCSEAKSLSNACWNRISSLLSHNLNYSPAHAWRSLSDLHSWKYKHKSYFTIDFQDLDKNSFILFYSKQKLFPFCQSVVPISILHLLIVLMFCILQTVSFCFFFSQFSWNLIWLRFFVVSNNSQANHNSNAIRIISSSPSVG